MLDFTHDLELSFGVPFPEPFRSSFHSLCTPCNITLPSFIFPQLLRGCSVSSVLSDSLRSYGLQPVRLLCPWNSPGKNTGVGCRFLFWGIFPTQGLNPHLLGLLVLASRLFTTEEAPRTYTFLPEDNKSNNSSSVRGLVLPMFPHSNFSLILLHYFCNSSILIIQFGKNENCAKTFSIFHLFIFSMKYIIERKIYV